MGRPCLKPLPLYKPRDPQASDLWRLLDGHFETFPEVYSGNSRPSTASGGRWLTARPQRSLSVGTFTKVSPGCAVQTVSTRCSRPILASSDASGVGFLA